MGLGTNCNLKSSDTYTFPVNKFIFLAFMCTHIFAGLLVYILSLYIYIYYK